MIVRYLYSKVFFAFYIVASFVILYVWVPRNKPNDVLQEGLNQIESNNKLLKEKLNSDFLQQEVKNHIEIRKVVELTEEIPKEQLESEAEKNIDLHEIDVKNHQLIRGDELNEETHAPIEINDKSNIELTMSKGNEVIQDILKNQLENNENINEDENKQIFDKDNKEAGDKNKGEKSLENETKKEADAAKVDETNKETPKIDENLDNVKIPEMMTVPQLNEELPQEQLLHDDKHFVLDLNKDNHLAGVTSHDNDLDKNNRRD